MTSHASTVLTTATEALNLLPSEVDEILDLVRIGGDCDNIGEVLSAVVRTARSVLGADAATLLMIDDDGELLTLRACDGLAMDEALGLATEVGQNLAGLVAQTGAPVRTSDVTLDRRSSLGPLCESLGIRAAILVPISRRDQVIGVLSAMFAAPRDFSDRDEFTLRILAKQASTTLAWAESVVGGQRREEQLGKLLNNLGRENDELRRLQEARARFADVILTGAGYDRLLSALGEFVPLPIVLVHQFGSRLATLPAGCADIEARWDACQNSSAFSRQLERIRSTAGAEPSPCIDGRGVWRIVPVTASSEILGALVVLHPGDLDPFHVALISDFSRIVASEMVRERRSLEAEARAHGSVVGSIVSSDGWGKATESRAALLGHDLTRPHCIVCLDQPTDSTNLQARELLAASQNAGSQSGLRVLVGEVDGVATVLLGAGDRALSRETVTTWIQAFSSVVANSGALNEIRFGVSEIPCEPGHESAAYTQARQAAMTCRMRKDRTWSFVEDDPIFATLIDLTKDGAVALYIDQTVGKLLEYDRCKSADLTHTLEVYLDCSGVARHAAKLLFLHPHSLRYRLRRIVEIQGIDLDDPMSRLSAHLALKLRGLATNAA